MQLQAEQNNCCLNELEVIHAGLTETEIFPTGLACFPSQPSQQVMNLKENSWGELIFQAFCNCHLFTFICAVEVFYSRKKKNRRAAFEVQGQINQLKAVMKIRARLSAFCGIFVHHLKVKGSDLASLRHSNLNL